MSSTFTYEIPSEGSAVVVNVDLVLGVRRLVLVVVGAGHGRGEPLPVRLS
ncbi:hypothetical protein [Streptomyces sp. NPDC051219]